MHPLTRELRAVHAALIYFTRLPLPSLRDSTADDWRRAATYFPLAGWAVGAVVGGVAWSASFVFPATIAAGLALAAGALLTGAMHEDGWADVCDGFGGGTTRERTLEIMRDSRIGAFGAIGLFLLVGLRWQALAALPTSQLIAAAIVAAALSRAASISLLASLDYARTEGKARPVVSRLRAPRVVTAWLIGLLPLLLLPTRWMWVVLPLLLMRAGAARWLHRRLGGYTGDCLGAVQQVGELVALLVFVALS